MSLFLFNQPNSPSLLETIYKFTQQMSDNFEDTKWEFYAMSCYFNPDEAKNLIRSIHQKLNKNLCKVHILIDGEEWIKNFIDINSFIEGVCNQTGLQENNVSLTPMTASNLFHAKCYALISTCKINSSYQGFGIITSGNFTKSGLNKNFELGQVTTTKDSPCFLEELLKIFEAAKEEYGIKNLSQPCELLSAAKLLSLGVFYHKWEQQHKIDLKFRLKLSQEEIQRRKKNSPNEQSRYRGFRVEESESLSIDPININSFFEAHPQPIPDGFLGSYGIDTLLGRWVPQTISELIEEELKISVDMYSQMLEEFLVNDMEQYLTTLRQDVQELMQAKIIDPLEFNAISEWEKHVKRIAGTPNLLKLLIWSYEKNSLSVKNLDMKLIESIADRIKIFYNKQPSEQKINSNKRRKSSGGRLGVGKTISELNWQQPESISANLFKEKITSAKKKLEANKIGDLEKIIEEEPHETTKENQNKPIPFVAILKNKTIIEGNFKKWDEQTQTIYYLLEGGQQESLKKEDIRTFKLTGSQL